MKKPKGKRIGAKQTVLKCESWPEQNRYRPPTPRWDPVEERPGYEIARDLSGRWRRSKDGAIIKIMRMMDELSGKDKSRSTVEVAKEIFTMSPQRFAALFQTVFEMESIEKFKRL